MRRNSRMLIVCVVVVLCAAVPPARAINLLVDYTYDTSNFFGNGNPQGATAGLQAKAALDAAATYFSGILTDSFSAISVPAPFHSSVSDGVVTWTWQQTFPNPATGSNINLVDQSVPLDRYTIYAGARGLTGATAGIGGPGGFSWASNISGTNSFTQSDINTINATTNTFSTAVETRGQATGFSRWGGAITFDTSSRTWSFDHTAAPAVGATDFYSVAIHELAHSLGFGESSSPSTAWGSQLSGVSFVGSNAVSQYGGPVPLAADFAHWAAGTNSVIYGTSTAQETAMDPDILNGTRKLFTALDAAALKDIGWSVATPTLNGDYNNNGKVDTADYVVWRNLLNQNVTIPNDTTPGNVSSGDYSIWRANFGASLSGSGSSTLGAGGNVPEPGAIAAALVGVIWWGLARRTRSRLPALDSRP